MTITSTFARTYNIEANQLTKVVTSKFGKSTNLVGLKIEKRKTISGLLGQKTRSPLQPSCAFKRQLHQLLVRIKCTS